jgi:hypothetical protein
MFNKWFDVFRPEYLKHKPDPQHIYNIDETGFSMGENQKAYITMDTKQTSLEQSVESVQRRMGNSD